VSYQASCPMNVLLLSIIYPALVPQSIICGCADPLCSF